MLQLGCMKGIGFVVLVSIVTGCGTPTPRALQLTPAPPGDAATVVASEMARARREGRELLVYVGATWCEPCRRFHQAAAAHKLDADFPRLRLLEFDSDRDGERLATAGDGSRLIPVVARPGADRKGGV